ncbi:MAG TPA: hypothetical protein VEQ66_16190 [Propionibacteriaceae bacterium]|nr:hypothetical protein [Propionibacteriaceae bacterium]
MPILLALLIGGLAVGLTQGWFRGGAATTTSSAPSVMATDQAVPSSSASTGTQSEGASGSGTASASQSSSSTESASGPSSEEPSSSTQSPSTQGAEAVRALQKCRSKVQARDRVLQAAATGVGHWSEHVDAQTDANRGDISTSQMQAIFKRTRLAGPADVKRYREALARDKQLSAACQPPSGAPARVTTAMANCAKRAQAQGPVLKAAEAAMNDWQSHLSDMRMSKMGHVSDPQGVWVKSWRAAPANIKPYRQATSNFDAPAC